MSFFVRSSEICFLIANFREQVGVTRIKVGVEPRLERTNLLDRELVEVALFRGENYQHFFFDRQRTVLPLLEHLGQPRAAGQQAQ